MSQTENKSPVVSLNLLDRAICKIAPSAGLKRIRSRAMMEGLKNSGFVSAGNSKRSLRGWLSSAGDADSDTLNNIESLRGRSRDAFYNIPIARAALKRTDTNAIGNGLKVQVRVKRDILGLKDDVADAWNRDVEERFHAWASSKLIDITGQQNFYELQSLSFMASMQSGDCFCTLPRRKDERLDNDLRLHIYEADFVSNPAWTVDTSKIAGGVEVDKSGRPIKYYFRSQHPGSQFLKEERWIPISPYGANSKRRQVLHLWDKDRPGQRRGYPFLAPVLEPLKQLARFTDAELMAAVVSSFFTVFVKTDSMSADPLEQSIASQVKLSDPENNPQDQNTYEMGSGNVIGLDENESVDFADPKRPSDKFDPFFLAIVRQIGASLEIPFEQLILHFTASYSAARAAMLEAWKFYRGRRNFMTNNFCIPIFEEWLHEEILAGRINAPGFLNDNYLRYAWSNTVWTGPGMGQIDPVKESKGANQRLADNLSTYEDEYTLINGGDWTDAMNRRSREETFLKEKNLASSQGENSNSDDPPGDNNKDDKTEDDAEE